MRHSAHGVMSSCIAGVVFCAFSILASATPTPTAAQGNSYSTHLVSLSDAVQTKRVTASQAVAAPFRTGDNANGYTISAVRLRFYLWEGNTAQPGDEIPGDRKVVSVPAGMNAVPVFAVSTSDPADVVVRLLRHDDTTGGPTEMGAVRLTSPDVLRSSSVAENWNLFSVPSGADVSLDSETTYYIEMSHSITGAKIPWQTGLTNRWSGASGWMLSGFLVRSVPGSTWGQGDGGNSSIPALRIDGSVNNPPAPSGSPPNGPLQVRVQKGNDPEDTSFIGGPGDIRFGHTIWIWPSEITQIEPDTPIGAFSQDIYTVPGSMESIDSIAHLLSTGMLVENGDGLYLLSGRDVGRRIVGCARYTDSLNNFNHVCSTPSPVIRGRNVGYTGAPAISGTARVGETLTADIGPIEYDDGVPLPDDPNFQWQRGESGNTPNWQDIPNAMSRTYTLMQDDVGKRIRVSVTFDDDEVTTATPDPSEAYPATTVRSQSPTGRPALSGSFSDGETMSIDTSAIMDPDGMANAPNWMYEYWLFPKETDVASLDRTISAANYPMAVLASQNSDTFLVDGSLANIETYRVLGVVTYTDDLGDTHTLLTALSRPFNTPASGAPQITGTLRVGRMLTADTASVMDGNGLEAYTYQWRVADDDTGTGATNAGTNSQHYMPVAEDLNKHLHVTVTFTDSDGYPETVESEWTDAVAAALSMVAVAPKSGGESVVGGEDAVFTLTRSGGDNTTTLDVTFMISGSGISSTSTSPTTATFPVGSPMVEVSVTTNTVAAAAADQTVTLTIQSSSDGSYDIDSSGGDTAMVTVTPVPPNQDATGTPTIAPTAEGPAIVGQTLVAARLPIYDPDGLPASDSDFRYQWTRVDADGSSNPVNIGTNSDTYTLVDDDADKRIRVTVSFNDLRGAPEMRTSEAYPATGTVQSQSGNATGAPAIMGTPQVGQTLTATSGNVDDSDGLPEEDSAFSFQWSRADNDSGLNAALIENANSATYTPVAADIGKHLLVTVSFTDGGGTPESRASEWTVAVLSAPLAISIAPPDSPVAEPAPGDTASLVFRVLLTTAATSDIAVTYSLSGKATEGVDYTVLSSNPSNTLTIPVGATEAPLTLSLVGDLVFEGTGETVIVALSDAGDVEIAEDNSSAESTITERTDQVVVSATIEGDFEYNEDSNQSTVKFDVAVASSSATPAGTVAWRVVFKDSANAEQGSDTGTASFAASESSSMETASISGNPPAGGTIEVQLGGFSALGVASAVQASSDVENGAETVTVSSQDYVIAAQATIRSSAAAKDWATTSALTAFGRSVATSLVDTIWNRAEAHRHSVAASYARLDGRSIDTAAFSSHSGARQAVSETARLLGVEAVDPAQVPLADAAGSSLVEGDFDDFRNWAGLSKGDAAMGRSSFSLALGEDGGSSIVYWGAGSLRNYASKLEDENFSNLESDGSTTTISLGLDYRRSSSMLLGLAVSSISGSSEYKFDTESDGNGELSSGLTSFTPWFRWKSPAGMEIWGALGIGSGAAESKHGSETVEMDLSAQIIAAGAWNQVTTFGSSNIAAKADVFSATVSSDGAGDAVDGADAGSSRIRVAAEMSPGQPASSERSSTYALELGARVDSGEAESGFGVDVAAEFGYGGPRSSLKVTGRGGLVLFHGKEGFSETGFELGITFDPGADARGLQLSVRPTWNAPHSSPTNALWSADSIDGLSQSESEGAAIETRLGYGVAAIGDHALATLYGSVRSERRESQMRLGSELQLLGQSVDSLHFDIYGEIKKRSQDTEKAVMLEGSMAF